MPSGRQGNPNLSSVHQAFSAQLAGPGTAISLFIHRETVLSLMEKSSASSDVVIRNIVRHSRRSLLENVAKFFGRSDIVTDLKST